MGSFIIRSLGISAGSAALIFLGIIGVIILLIILGFVIYKYFIKSNDPDDDDETFYDEDRAIINENRGKVKKYI